MPIDGLPRGNRAMVFKRIVEQLRTDPTLSMVIKADSWGTWEGGSADLMPDNLAICPYIKLVPALGAVGWYSPDAQLGPLEIQIQIGVEGVDALDCLDLWDVFERAIYPFNDPTKQLAFEQALRDLGAETGQITFARPATIQGIETANINLKFTCLGMMSINVIRPFNP